MGNPLPNRLLARLAAGFMAVAGAIGLVTAGLTPPPGLLDPALSQAVSWTAVALGVLGWFLPWDRWPRAALFAFVPLAMALKGVGAYAGGANPYTYALHFLVLFMWIGIALPAWGWLAAVPFLVPAYAVPALLLDQREALESLAGVATAAVFVGGAASWLSGRLRRAERESELRAVRMSRLVDATVALASCQEVSELARLTALGAIDVCGGEGALVLLDEGGELRPVGDAGWPGPLSSEVDRDCMDALRHWLLHADEDPEGPGRTGWLARRLGVQVVDALPLQGSAGFVGVALVALSSRGRPDPFTAYVGRTLATQAGLGFERVLAARALLDDSLNDPLTGIGNRRRAALQLELLKAGDVVALIDLDHFKRVNDSYGHLAGDRVLRALAAFLQGSVRGPDEVFRYGGEEFLLLLQGGGPEATHAVHRIHAAWSAQRRVTTFSAGVAIHREGDDPEETVERADAALYDAKRRGRDRVVTALERPSEAES